MSPIRTFFPLLVCFLLSSSCTLAMAKETWTISQTIHTESNTGTELQARSVVYEVSGAASSIVSNEESIYIDYEDMRLYRLDPKTSACRSFPLDVPEAADRDAIIASNIRELMAEIVARENGKKQRIGSIDCSGKDVLFGAGLLRMKTVAPIKVEYLDQSFIETTGEYWISSSMVTWQLFEEKIAKRQAAFAINPLLKRIDPLGLIQSLGGFPVQGVERSKGKRVESVLVKAPTSIFSKITVPEACRAAALKNPER